MKERLLHDVEAAFKPEFIGRLDDVIVFRELNRDNLKRIVDIELAKVRERLAERGLALEMTDSAREFVIDKGSNTEYGARPLRRSVEQFIEDPLSEELLRGAFEGHNSILVDAVPMEGEDADDKDAKQRLDFTGRTVAKPDLPGVTDEDEAEESGESAEEEGELVAVGAGGDDFSAADDDDD